MARLELPKKPGRDLVDAIDQEMAQSDQEAAVNLVPWKIIDAYLAGARRFRILDRLSGELSIALENAKGELSFRYEEVVNLYLTEVGRFLKMDITPFVGRSGEGLDALRKASIGHAALNGLMSRIPSGIIKRRAIIPFLKYGTVGVCHYETGDFLIPDMMDVVPPKQLRGFPAWVDGLESLQATCRKRWVPLDWITKKLKDVYGITKRFDPVADLKAEDVPWGTSPPGSTTLDIQGLGAGKVANVQKKDLIGLSISKKGDPRSRARLRDGRLYVPMEELFILDDTGGFLARYILKLGDHIAITEDFEAAGRKQIPPLHIARHTDTGRFFARGFVSRLLTFNNEIEKLLGNLFKNIAELDMFGTLMVPGSSGIDIKRWRTGPRPKAEKFEADPVSPTMLPFNLTPANAGTMPGKVAEFAMKKMTELASQGPYYGGQTSGRIDSAAGLGFLFNTGNVGLGLPTNGLADAFAGVYSRMLQAAKERSGPGDIVKIAVIDDAVAGVILNPSTGEMSLADNPLPDPWDVKVDIRDRAPRDPDVRKQELVALHQQGLVDNTRFWIAVLEEDLGFPGAPKEVWETWRKAIWQIIILFRDGETPGPLIFGKHDQDPEVQLIAVQKFMNKIEYSLASEEVQEEFEKWKTGLEAAAGRVYPVGLPPPEEAAVQQQAAMRQAPPPGGMGGPGGLSELAGMMSR